MQFTNVRSAKANLSRYLNSLEESGPVIITCRGVPKAVISSLSEDELDSFIIRHSQAIYEEAVAGVKEISEGKTYSVDEAFEKIAEIRTNDKKH